MFIVLCLGANVLAYENPPAQEMTQATPPYLYKIISVEDWKTSKCMEKIKLSSDDSQFIHFSTEDQLDRIIAKYWSNSKQFVVLKIDSSKLPGNLVYESNPGGSNKYYHLYDGYIPLDAVTTFKVINPT